jgi:3-oxoacyl-[acyl-carrier-protein] synthase II
MTTTTTTTTDVRVAITGMGLITPLGDTAAAVGAALAEGRTSIAAAADLPEFGESRIPAFEATRYANVRGMRLYNRTTSLGLCAAKLALTDAGLEGGASLPAGGLGLVVASTYAHLDTLIEYDRSLVTLGIQQTNPALMPLSIASAPGAAIAMAFTAKAFAVTLASEGASGLDALAMGMRLVAAGRADACLVVGAFAPCRELSLSSARAGQLAPAGEVRVFDARHRGRVFGEAGAAVVLERVDAAQARGAAIKGILAGQGSVFAPAGTPRPDALRRACEAALRAAGRSPRELAFVSSGANALPRTDEVEAQALLSLLVDGASVPVTSIKSALGDLVDASGVVQAVLALDSLAGRMIPPVAGLQEPALSGLRYASTPIPVSGVAALVTGTSDVGSCSAIVVERL